jgi:hypothetical protein
MGQRTRTYRGISARAAIGYLEGLGGEQTDERAVEGDGWTAELSAETVGVGPTLTLTEITVEFEGDAGTLDPLIDAFSQKAMRAGG